MDFESIAFAEFRHPGVLSDHDDALSLRGSAPSLNRSESAAYGYVLVRMHG
jgi:hypothetical protein